MDENSYWYIGYKNDIRICYNHSDRYVDTDVTKQREAIGNRFTSFEEAKKALDQLKAVKKLKDNGFTPTLWEWEQRDDGKCSIIVKFDTCFDAGICDKELDLLFGGKE